MTKEERDLLLIVARIVLETYNSSGPDGNKRRKALLKALQPFNDEIGAKFS